MKKQSTKKIRLKPISIAEAAKKYQITRQAVYVAIKNGKLKAEKIHSRWVITEENLEEYREKRYSREHSVFDGEPLFNNDEGYFSVNQTAEMLGIPAQKVYYATRAGLLKGTRKGAAWIFHKEQIDTYKKEYLDRIPPRFRAS